MGEGNLGGVEEVGGENIGVHPAQGGGAVAVQLLDIGADAGADGAFIQLVPVGELQQGNLGAAPHLETNFPGAGAGILEIEGAAPLGGNVV